MPRKKTLQKQSERLNMQTYIDYSERLQSLAMNQFKWNNLPPTVDERFIELNLYNRGYILYFNDEEIGNLALPCTLGGPYNVYNIPSMRQAFASNGYTRACNEYDSVIIYNNYLHTAMRPTIELYALRIAEIERAIDVNVKAMKTPVLVLCTEEQRLTLQNLYMQYDGNQPFIFGDKTLDTSGFKVLKTDSPYTADKMQVLKHQLINECLTYCGIENSNTDKRERLITDEVMSNMGNIQAHRNIMLNARQQAAEQINRMFGTNITVEFREPVYLNGSEEDVEIHDTSTLDSGDESQ